MLFKEKKLVNYLNTRSAYQSKAIPNKSTFTFISRMGEIPQLWKWSDKQEPVPFGKFEDRVLSVHHSPTGEKTVIGMDRKGDEKQQLYLVQEDGAKVEPLVDEPEYFHNFGGWSPDERYITFSSNRRHPGHFDIFVQDVETKELETVYQFDGNCVPLQWVDDENILFTIKETNIDQTIYILNINTKKTNRIGKEGVLARYQSINLAKGGKEGYILTDVEDETLYLCRFSMEKPDQLEKLIHWQKWDIEEIKLSPNEDKLAFTVNEGGISKLYVLDLTTTEKKAVQGLQDGVIDSLSWLTNDQFIFTLKTPVMPGEIWCFTVSNKKLGRLTYVSQDKEVEGLWKEPELCAYQSFDGLEVPYFYYENETGTDKPCVIYVHGGPESQFKAEYNPVIQYLVHQGFAVAAPNVRGSNGYGRTYIKLDDAQKRMDAVKDLEWLVKDLIDTKSVNPEKIGIMGRSYGGFMVLAALTHYPDLWAAGVDIVGVANLRTLLENTGAWRRHLRACEYGTLEENSNFFDEIAPANHAYKIKVPLLVFHGRNDTRVPVSESEELVKGMKSRGQDVEFTVFEDEGHQTEKLENHITMNGKIVEFFDKNLKG